MRVEFPHSLHFEYFGGKTSSKLKCNVPLVSPARPSTPEMSRWRASGERCGPSESTKRANNVTPASLLSLSLFVIAAFCAPESLKDPLGVFAMENYVDPPALDILFYRLEMLRCPKVRISYMGSPFANPEVLALCILLVASTPTFQKPKDIIYRICDGKFLQDPWTMLEFFAGKGNLSLTMVLAGHSVCSFDLNYDAAKGDRIDYRSNCMDMNSPSGFALFGSNKFTLPHSRGFACMRC